MSVLVNPGPHIDLDLLPSHSRQLFLFGTSSRQSISIAAQITLVGRRSCFIFISNPLSGPPICKRDRKTGFGAGGGGEGGRGITAMELWYDIPVPPENSNPISGETTTRGAKRIKEGRPCQRSYICPPSLDHRLETSVNDIRPPTHPRTGLERGVKGYLQVCTLTMKCETTGVILLKADKSLSKTQR